MIHLEYKDPGNQEISVPHFHFHLSDGKQADMSLDLKDQDEAMNVGMNALCQYVAKQFPPPDKIEISIASQQGPIATLRFSFEVEFASVLAAVR